MNNFRYHEMLETTNLAKEYLKDKLNQLYNQNVITSKDQVNYLYNIRFNNKIWLRPYITRLIYEKYSIGNNWREIIPAITASEVFNISTYQSNIVFDNKVGFNNKSFDSNQYIASMLSYDIVVKLLSESNYESRKTKDLIDKLVECNSKVYLGQYLDLNFLVLNNKEKVFDFSKEQFLNHYMNRCMLIGGSTIDCCSFWALTLANAEKEEIELYSLILSNWGKLMQVINDLSDYLYFIDKNNYKRFSDLKHGKITLPLYLMIMLEKENKNGLKLDYLLNYDLEKLNEIIPKILYKDSIVSLEILDILYKEWIYIKEMISRIDNFDMIQSFTFLFENLFLTKYARYFFSNKMIRYARKKFK